MLKPALFVAVLVALSQVGCSVALMKRVPSDHPPDDYPDCSSSYTLPLGDAVLTVLAGASAVNLHSAAGNPENDDKPFRALAWTATGGAVAFLASAAYGAVQRNRCRRAKVRSGFREDRRRPNVLPPGSRGGRCRADGSCDGDLICDAPMSTCVPVLETDESLPPSE